GEFELLGEREVELDQAVSAQDIASARSVGVLRGYGQDSRCAWRGALTAWVRGYVEPAGHASHHRRAAIEIGALASDAGIRLVCAERRSERQSGLDRRDAGDNPPS